MMEDHLHSYRDRGDHRILRAFASEMLKIARDRLGDHAFLKLANKLLDDVLEERMTIKELLHVRYVIECAGIDDLPDNEEDDRRLRLAYQACHPSAFEAALAVHNALFDDAERFTADKSQRERWMELDGLCDIMRTFVVSADLTRDYGPQAPRLPHSLPVIEAVVDDVLRRESYQGWRCTSISRLSSRRPYFFAPDMDEDLCWAAAITREPSNPGLRNSIDGPEGIYLVIDGLTSRFIGHARKAPSTTVTAKQQAS